MFSDFTTMIEHHEFYSKLFCTINALHLNFNFAAMIGCTARVVASVKYFPFFLALFDCRAKVEPEAEYWKGASVAEVMVTQYLLDCSIGACLS